MAYGMGRHALWDRSSAPLLLPRPLPLALTHASHRAHAANYIDAAGATALAEALKTNTAITTLNLWSACGLC